MPERALADFVVDRQSTVRPVTTKRQPPVLSAQHGLGKNALGERITFQLGQAALGPIEYRLPGVPTKRGARRLGPRARLLLDVMQLRSHSKSWWTSRGELWMASKNFTPPVLLHRGRGTVSVRAVKCVSSARRLSACLINGEKLANYLGTGNSCQRRPTAETAGFEAISVTRFALTWPKRLPLKKRHTLQTIQTSLTLAGGGSGGSATFASLATFSIGSLVTGRPFAAVRTDPTGPHLVAEDAYRN